MFTVRARLFSAAASEKVIELPVRAPLTHLLPKGVGPRPTVKTTRTEALNYFTDIATIRRMEVSCDNLYKAKFIRGFLHLYDGQEGVCVGMEGALTREDMLITAYRCHGNQYMRERSVPKIIAELMGRKTGSSKGKGGSMHLYDVPNNFFGGNGIVGAQAPVGTGLALALQYQGKKNCAITMFGDGAANQGQIFEAQNMAKLWKLPCIYVCENNRYGMGTSVERSSQNVNYYTRGDQIPGMKVWGVDVYTVREAVRFAKEWAINEGPIILEFETYRFHGHSMSDPGTSYRTKEEVSAMRDSSDPLENLRKTILDNKLATEDELSKIEKDARVLVDEAIKFAQESPEPELSALKADIVKRPEEVPHPRGPDMKNDPL